MQNLYLLFLKKNLYEVLKSWTQATVNPRRKKKDTKANMN